MILYDLLNMAAVDNRLESPSNHGGNIDSAVVPLCFPKVHLRKGINVSTLPG